MYDNCNQTKSCDFCGQSCILPLTKQPMDRQIYCNKKMVNICELILYVLKVNLFKKWLNLSYSYSWFHLRSSGSGARSCESTPLLRGGTALNSTSHRGRCEIGPCRTHCRADGVRQRCWRWCWQSFRLFSGTRLQLKAAPYSCRLHSSHFRPSIYLRLLFLSFGFSLLFSCTCFDFL